VQATSSTPIQGTADDSTPMLARRSEGLDPGRSLKGGEGGRCSKDEYRQSLFLAWHPGLVIMNKTSVWEGSESVVSS